MVRGGVIGASAKVVPARFDLDAAAEALSREAEAWQHLVRVARKVSRQADGAVTADFTSLPTAPGRYRVRAGEVPGGRPGRRARPPSPELAQRPRLDETPGGAHVDQVVPGTHDHRRRARRRPSRCAWVDLVIEVLDARVPRSSCNPTFEELRRGGQKPALKLLNKSDMADPEHGGLRPQHYNAQPGVQGLALCSKKPARGRSHLAGLSRAATRPRAGRRQAAPRA